MADGTGFCAPNAGVIVKGNALHWFRHGLRLHDNPALNHAVRRCVEGDSAGGKLFCLFVVDRSRFELPRDEAHNVRMSAARHKFLHDCLSDLDGNLRRRGSRLIVAHGDPARVIPKLLTEWRIGVLTYEKDIAPYSMERDALVNKLAIAQGVEVYAQHSKTLYDLDMLKDKGGGRIPLTYNGFQKLAAQAGRVAKPVAFPEGPIPGPDENLISEEHKQWIDTNEHVTKTPLLFPGGETEALRRLERSLSDPKWVANFQKPKTSPNSLDPSTTVLSPYLAMGCLSPKVFWHRLAEIYARHPKHSVPPVSLQGQLLFREYFHAVGYTTENFGRMEGNAICKQIPWDRNDELLDAWEYSRTGYPFIDAIMAQLRMEGWIHHLARHAVACFLTRGDLWQSWERGASVFEKYLLDGDWSLNISNWLWLSASAFFYQYFRVYSPISFGKKTDPNGEYIRKYLPVLKNMPHKYIYEPWTAPKEVQMRAGCIIGTDYPKPIVDHAVVSKQNMQKMKLAYENQASGMSSNSKNKPNSKGGDPPTKRRRF